MNNLDFYTGKAIRSTVEDSGRKSTVLHYLVAAVLQANDDSVTFAEIIKMLNEINDFQPIQQSREQSMKELGF